MATQTPNSILKDSSETPVSEESFAATNSFPTPSISEGPSFSDEAALPPLFPTPKQAQISKWSWLGLLASVGLHLGLMLIPTGSEPKPEPPKQQEKQVRITQFPKLVKPVTVPKKVVKPAIKPLVKPAVRSQLAPPPIPRPTPTPTPAAANIPDTPGASAWDDFPIYPGSQPGCFNLSSCQQTADAVNLVAAFYEKELPAKKYTIKPIVKQADKQVFQVSRGDQSQFLNVLQTEKGSLYVLAPGQISLEELKKAVEVPPEVAAILSNLDAQNADSSSFAQPELFYTQSTDRGLGAGTLVPKSAIRTVSLVSGYMFDTMMDEFFRSNLQNNDFEIIDIPQDFGGGKVYELTKGSLKLYLNLVPTKDNSGTLVVVWKDPPRL